MLTLWAYQTGLITLYGELDTDTEQFVSAVPRGQMNVLVDQETLSSLSVVLLLPITVAVTTSKCDACVVKCLNFIYFGMPSSQ